LASKYIKKKKINIFKNFCVSPKPLVIIYSLSIAVSGKAKKIFLAGFDGLKQDDPNPSADETSFLLNKFKSKNKKFLFRTITKTNLNIPFFKI
jgi:4-hydroxy 2-oxovalerate aldolase